MTTPTSTSPTPIDPNAPAYARSSGGYANSQSGMSTRTAFILAAMEGLCANPYFAEKTYEDIAKVAVQQADATIAATNRVERTPSP